MMEVSNTAHSRFPLKIDDAKVPITQFVNLCDWAGFPRRSQGGL